MLHYEAVSEDLLNVIKHLMELEELKSFALVGGTALALHLGHRSSVDIDLFTDHSFDVKETITVILKNVKGNVILARPNGAQLLLNDIKVDLYNWAVPFLEDTFEDGLRLASLKDIAAFKLDAVSSRKTKKDFYDIYFLLTQMSFSEMISCYQKKYPLYNIKTVLAALSAISKADDSEAPELLKNIPWDEVKKKIKKEIADYEQTLIQNSQQKAAEREEKIRGLIRKKKG